MARIGALYAVLIVNMHSNYDSISLNTLTHELLPTHHRSLRHCSVYRDTHSGIDCTVYLSHVPAGNTGLVFTDYFTTDLEAWSL